MSLSRFLSGSSSTGGPVLQTLSFESSDQGGGSVQRLEPSGVMFPLFTYTSRHNIQLHRVGAGNTPLQPTMIGTATFHSMSSKADMDLQGQSIHVKQSNMTGAYKLEYQPVGKLRWETGKLTGRKLVGEAGAQIARYRAGTHNETLEISVACNDAFLDLIVLSAIAVRTLIETELEMVGEVMDAVGGGGA